MAPTTDLSITSTAPGTRMPVLGLGTWRSEKGKVKDVVVEALRIGYRHIDTAQAYGNQEEVGDGIQEAIDEGYVKLEDLWVTGKLWNYDFRKEQVRPACEKILRELKIPKIQHVLMHWPIAFAREFNDQGNPVQMPKTDDGKPKIDDGANLVDTWKAMEELVDAGLTETIGVSNFSEDELKNILKIARIKPMLNQVECHPYFQQDGMREFLRSEGMVMMAYSPLGNITPDDDNEPTPLEDEVIVELAGKYSKSPAQIILRWGLQKGNVVIPKTVHEERIAENADVFSFSLSDEDMERISALKDKGKQYRLNNPAFREGGQKVFQE